MEFLNSYVIPMPVLLITIVLSMDCICIKYPYLSAMSVIRFHKFKLIICYTKKGLNGRVATTD